MEFFRLWWLPKVDRWQWNIHTYKTRVSKWWVSMAAHFWDRKSLSPSETQSFFFRWMKIRKQDYRIGLSYHLMITYMTLQVFCETLCVNSGWVNIVFQSLRVKWVSLGTIFCCCYLTNNTHTKANVFYVFQINDHSSIGLWCIKIKWDRILISV